MTEAEAMKRWGQAWKTAGPLLERIRREELRKLDTLRTIEALTFAIDFSKDPFRPKPTSGLIEQQRLFTKLRDA
jgi:hypothetical protein